MMEWSSVIHADEQPEHPERSRGPRRVSRQTSPVILIVDARMGRLDCSAASLLEGDYQVFSAESDSAALDVLETQPVDLVLLDEDAGLPLIEEIHARGHDVVIVVLSERPSLLGARDAMLLGAYAYMSRPCDPKLLQAMLAAACVLPAREEHG